MKRALSFYVKCYQHLNPQSPTYLDNMIIAYLGRNVKEYRRNCLKFLEELKLTCPICSGNTSFHDSYDRHVHVGEEIPQPMTRAVTETILSLTTATEI